MARSILVVLSVLCAASGQATPPERRGTPRGQRTSPREPTHQNLKRKHLRSHAPKKAKRESAQAAQDHDVAQTRFVQQLRKLLGRFDRQAPAARSEDSLNALQREVLTLKDLDFYENTEEVLYLKAQLNERMRTFNLTRRGSFDDAHIFDMSTEDHEGDGLPAQPLPDSELPPA